MSQQEAEFFCRHDPWLRRTGTTVTDLQAAVAVRARHDDLGFDPDDIDYRALHRALNRSADA